MDRTNQLYVEEATGWQRGLYDDITATFRAPIVNWIFRTLMANDPAFTRYLWGQVKPVFETQAFGRLSIAHRDAVLHTIEIETSLPTYRRADLEVSPGDYAELKGQLATFDIVAPRLAVLFALVDRALEGDGIDGHPEGHAATAPLPGWLDRDRGRPPTMIDDDGVPDALAPTVEYFRDVHGIDAGLPSIYRCLAQWPTLLEALRDDVGPILESASFDRGRAAARDLVEDHVDGLAYTPRLAPDDLRTWGLDRETVASLRELFAGFQAGPATTVVPALHLYAATVDVAGPRAWP